MRLGQYELEGELGRGGAGRVYRARHVPTGAPRAVKVLEGASDPEGLVRFRREAEALARVGPGFTVAVHETGSERGRTFYAMDLMPGGSLAARLAPGTPWPWRDALALGAKLARAVERCHEVGLVHRDLKPANVLFDAAGEPRLADFGCVRDLAASQLTATGSSPGTPAYMAPEQLDGGRGDERSDVYALAVVLHELVTGHGPHDGRTWRELLERRRQGMPAPVAAAAGAPVSLDGVLARALEPDPARRTPGAGALAEELEALLAPGGGESAPSGRRAVVALVALLAIGALALAGAVGSSRSPGPVPPAPSPRVSPRASPSPSPSPPAEIDLESPGLGARLAAAAARPEGQRALERLAREARPVAAAEAREAAKAAPGSSPLAVLAVVSSVCAREDLASWPLAEGEAVGQASLRSLGKGGALVLAALAVRDVKKRVDTAEIAGEKALRVVLERLEDDPALVAAVLAPLDSYARDDSVLTTSSAHRLDDALRRVEAVRRALPQLTPGVAVSVLVDADRSFARWPELEDQLRARAAALAQRDPPLAAVAQFTLLKHVGETGSPELETLTRAAREAREAVERAEKAGGDESAVLRLRFELAKWLAGAWIELAQRSLPASPRAALEDALAASREAVTLEPRVLLGTKPQFERVADLVALLLYTGDRDEARTWESLLAPEDALHALLRDDATPESLDAAIEAASRSRLENVRGFARGLKARRLRARGDVAGAVAIEKAPEPGAKRIWLAGVVYEARFGTGR